MGAECTAAVGRRQASGGQAVRPLRLTQEPHDRGWTEAAWPAAGMKQNAGRVC